MYMPNPYPFKSTEEQIEELNRKERAKAGWTFPSRYHPSRGKPPHEPVSELWDICPRCFDRFKRQEDYVFGVFQPNESDERQRDRIGLRQWWKERCERRRRRVRDG